MALLLAACGGDSSSSSDDDPLREVSSIYDLGACTTDREGDTVLVLDQGIDYLCKNNDWIDITTPIGDGQQANKKDKPDYVIKNASITGAALKGPFKFDTPLKLRELRLVNDSLRYTGNDYIDEISSNKGDFVIPKVNLVYPYAELAVNGLWQNEVTGQWSKNTLSLHALADLNERTEVNINLLTDLEYDRAVKLVNKGYSVLAAKKQAEFEIMTAFGFATTVENAEDLKMFVDSADSKRDANATLMAISLLFLGDRSDSAFAAAMKLFKNDFTPDGSWDNDQSKVEMADWAETFDKTTVRVNVKSWNILDIPKFETYLDIFWNNVYGLGGCAENRYGTIAKNTNTLSKNYNVHYICVDKTWRRATDYEKDTYQWANGRDGEIKKGDVTGTDYVFKNGTWIALNGVADDETCDKTRTGEKLSKNGLYYACENGVWKEIEEKDYYVVRNISVTGSAQKGPFKFDSPLKIKEMLLRNETLIYTGREYVDEISSNTGDFVVPKVSLVYPYATLEVRGLWRNEITGEWSRDSMTLRALTELSGNANINILTHLEYDRALNLVKKGYSVSAAKTQADYEIMTAFAIIPTTSNSEAKLTFGDGADPTLLALAILFIGDRSDVEILNAIDDFKADIASDGVWNDEQTKADMADYAEDFNSSVVHANVKSWNISVIPNFEAQLATFWNNAYGLGGCSSTRDGMVLQNSNSLSSNYGVHYICKSNAWRRATDYEKDTYQWTAGTTGEVKKGNITNTYYSYNGSTWVVADRENTLGLCAGTTGVVAEYDGTYYICKSNSWQTATALEYDTYGWTAGTDGEVKAGSVNASNYYVYENGAWRASTGVIENNLGACVTSRLGEVGKSGSTYYTCKTGGWTSSTVLEYDTYGWTAGADGEVRIGNVNTNTYYVYENGAWRASSGTIENNLGACVTSRLGEVGKSGSAYYTCKTDGWTTSTVLEYDTYGWTAGTNGEVRPGNVITSNYYVCENGIWRTATGTIEIELGGCVVNRRGEVVKLENTYYICKNSGWQTATPLEYDTYGWTAGTNGEVRPGNVITSNYYVCENGIWRAATGTIEIELGGCVVNRRGEVVKLENTYYICENSGWRTATPLEYDTYGWTAGTNGEVRPGNVNTSNYYVYENGIWRASTGTMEVELGGCVVNRRGEVVKFGDIYYICKNNGWQTATVLEYDTYGLECTSDKIGVISNGVVIGTSSYYCSAGGWISLMEWNWIVPKEYRFNTAVTYGTFTESIERGGQTYKIVTIGTGENTQIWMAENLNYYDASLSGRSWCYGRLVDTTPKCAVAGRLYKWSAAVGRTDEQCGHGTYCSFNERVQGICPEGWHLPSVNDWNTLFTNVGGEDVAGKVLKSQTGWNNYNGSSGNGTDIFGFSALPAGKWEDFGNGEFRSAGDCAVFWSATAQNIDGAYGVFLCSGMDKADIIKNDRSDMLSIRCVHD